jgi:hypothetical protein
MPIIEITLATVGIVASFNIEARRVGDRAERFEPSVLSCRNNAVRHVEGPRG